MFHFPISFISLYLFLIYLALRYHQPWLDHFSAAFYSHNSFFFLPSSLSRNTNHCFLPEPTAFCNLHLGYLCLCGESFKLVSATEVAIISVELRGGGEWAWLYILRLRAITASFACLAMRSQRPPAARSRAAARAFSLRFFVCPSSKSIDSVKFASNLHCYLVGVRRASAVSSEAALLAPPSLERAEIICSILAKFLRSFADRTSAWRPPALQATMLRVSVDSLTTSP